MKIPTGRRSASRKKTNVSWLKWLNPARLPSQTEPLMLWEKASRDSFRYAEDSPNPPPSPVMLGGVSMGTLGIVPVWDSTQADDLFNFWVAHTDRRITRSDFNTLRRVDGVEELTPLTCYRFRIAVGQMFRTEDVQRAVEDALNGRD
jgi:hypothetical protein